MVILKISGKNKNNFIYKLYQNKINLYKIKYKDDNIYIYINKDDLEKVKKLKSIYDVSLVGFDGFIKIKKEFENNFVFFISIIFGIFLIYLLGNIVFNIDIITNNNKIKSIINQELYNNGIYKYSFKKSFNEKNKIKNIILSKYKDNIEWLEIDYIGTRCIVKFEERIKENKNNKNELQNIVALKDAVILDVKASQGNIIKRSGMTVKKGDIIISGNIYLNDTIKNVVSASGKVMGEVWYKNRVSFPLFYKEEKLSGNKKIRYSFKLFNKEFNFYKLNGKLDKRKIFENKLFSLYKNIIYEVINIDNIYTYDEAIEKALELSRNNIKSKLNVDEYIIYEKCLKVSLNESKIEVEVFYAVCENITAYERIEYNG